MNWKVLLAGVAIIIPLVVLLALGFGRNPKLVSNALEGHPAPTFDLATMDGLQTSLAALRGKPVVLNFWSTWCQPCKLEHELLLESARQYKPRGVVFLGVLYQDEADKARRYLDRYGSAYPTLLDPGGRMSIAYGIAGVPETFFIDREGRIVHKVTGPLNSSMMIEALERVL